MLTEFWVSLVFVFVLWFGIVAFWVCVLCDYVGVWVIWAFAILMVCWICKVGLLVVDFWLLLVVLGLYLWDLWFLFI